MEEGETGRSYRACPYDECGTGLVTPAESEPGTGLRDQLSSAQGLLVLSMLITESGEEQEILAWRPPPSPLSAGAACWAFTSSKTSRAASRTAPSAAWPGRRKRKMSWSRPSWPC